MDGINLPTLVAAGVMLIGSVVTAWFNRQDKREDRAADREPSIESMWARIDELDRKLTEEARSRRRTEAQLFNLYEFTVHYVDRVQGGGDSKLTDTEVTTLQAVKDVVM